MRRVVLGVSFLMAGALLGAAARPPAFDESDSVLMVGGLRFSIPDPWQNQPVEAPARVAHWRIAPPHRPAAEGVEVVVFFFGPGIGGSAKENIDAWADLVTSADGSSAVAQPQTRSVAGHKITQVLLSGNYAEPGSEPGIPPIVKPAYSLFGAVLENAQGNIYWRATGPTAQVAALVPLFGKVLDSLKPQPDSKP
jgi:hypothetical protein